MNTAIAIPHARFGDFLGPILEVGLIGALTTIVVARSLCPKHCRLAGC